MSERQLAKADKAVKARIENMGCQHSHVQVFVWGDKDTGEIKGELRCVSCSEKIPQDVVVSMRDAPLPSGDSID